MSLNSSNSNDKSGTGSKQGPFSTPQESCGYNITSGAGGGVKGGEPAGPFASPPQSPSELPITTRDTMQANSYADGRFQTPMNGTTSIGATGNASGTGPKQGEISTPMTFPFGHIGGK